MKLFKQKDQRGATSEGIDDLRDEIERLTAANRTRPDRATERRLLLLRFRAGVQLVEREGEAAYPDPDFAGLPASGGLPEVAAEAVTPAVVRGAILRDGCLLVRGLVTREDALRFGAQIDRAFAARAAFEAGGAATAGYYEEFEPETRFKVASVRPWIRDGGGVLASDSPMLTYEMLELFETAAVPRLAEGYLGEPPLLSVHKTTLRKAEPSVPGSWHQDGAFMGEVRALNLWLSLSRCGDEAPGLDVVPRRLDEVVISQEDMLDPERARAAAEAAAGGVGILRPIFEPGDALFFDELFLHQTASDPAMPKPRFAIEAWFFGASAFPGDYAPVAV
jgi:hypothetical protein